MTDYTRYQERFAELDRDFIAQGEPHVTEEEVMAMSESLARSVDHDGEDEDSLALFLANPEKVFDCTQSVKRHTIVRSILKVEGLWPPKD